MEKGIVIETISELIEELEAIKERYGDLSFNSSPILSERRSVKLSIIEYLGGFAIDLSYNKHHE